MRACPMALRQLCEWLGNLLQEPGWGNRMASQAGERAVVLPGSATGETTTSELGFFGSRRTEIRWSARWLLMHSWSERRGSTVRGGAPGASASRNLVSDVMDEPARMQALGGGHSTSQPPCMAYAAPRAEYRSVHLSKERAR